MRVLVTGSREWADHEQLWQVLSGQLAIAENHGLGFTLVHGSCPTGADKIADEWARFHEVDVERHPADWEKHGKAAGPLRNKAMVKAGADVCLAFIREGLLTGNRGTLNCAHQARQAGITVLRFYS